MTYVYMGTPAADNNFPGQYVATVFTTRLKGRLGWGYLPGQAIDIGRNAIVERALKDGADYLLMHDSDATWHPGAVQRLLERDLPVVTGVIFKRSLPTVPTIGTFVRVDPDGSHIYSFADTLNHVMEIARRESLRADTKNELLFDPHPDDLQEIDACGSHFMLIRRDVLEKIKPPWFKCTTTNGGEDFYFCRQVQKAKFKMYVDYSVFTGHVMGKGMELGIREFLLYNNTAKVETLWKA